MTPPRSPLVVQEAGGEAAEGEGCSAAAAIVNVDGEVALIVLRASGGTCRFTYGSPGMTGAPHAAVSSGLKGKSLDG